MDNYLDRHIHAEFNTMMFESDLYCKHFMSEFDVLIN